MVGIGETSGYFEFDKKGEECGVFGIYAPGEPVAILAYDALFALQNRGQAAAGVAVTAHNGSIIGYKDLGIVAEALRKGEALSGLPPANIATGHVRYSTVETDTKKAKLASAQPMLSHNGRSKFALSHNGHLVNFDVLRQLHPKPEECYTDSILITNLIGQEIDKGAGLYDSIVEVAKNLIGAYSLVIMGEGKLFGVRDPKGFRPLVLGNSPDPNKPNWALASEVGALDIIGSQFDREVQPGEIVEIGADGVKTYHPFEASEVSTNVCAFEFVYNSRPDNVIEGEVVGRTRRRAGIELAKLHPVKADMVLDAPNSGTWAAIGYAHQSGLPLEPGLIKNQYVNRTFIAAGQAARKSMVKAKFNAVPGVIDGQSVVLVDDSIIRGNTTRGIISTLRDAGAREVHVRIASDLYKSPCFMGMDTGNIDELIAAGMSVEEICEAIGADTLAYLPAHILELSLGRAFGKVCMACMTGKYPIPIPQELLQLNN